MISGSTPSTVRGSARATAAGASASDACSDALTIAPNKAAPRLWPRNRQNISEPVAVPRRAVGTDDCTPTTSGVETSPSPAPSTSVDTTTSQPGGRAGPATNTSTPTSETTAPMSAVSRNPIRRYSRLQVAAASGQLMLIVASTNPAVTAP